MKLNRIELEGFKSIKKLEFELNDLNVLIGANGAGKTNFISLFAMLNEMVEGRLQKFVAESGGADTFLYFGEKETDRIIVKLNFGRNSYKCEWIPTRDDLLIFDDEICYYMGKGYDAPYRDWLGSGHKESSLSNKERKASKVEGYVLENLKSWRLYHFHDTSDTALVKKPGGINDNMYLRPDAGNLAAFLFRMREEDEREYKNIRDTVRMVAPFFDDFILRPMGKNKDKIRLEWLEKESDYPFLAHHFSDGTLRFICLATLLLQPVKPSTILIDEPELGLHPYAIAVLAGLFRVASNEAQIIASTQSVPLVNQLYPKDIIVVDRANRQSVFNRPSEKEMESWLNDYGLGDLWEKNILGGRP